MFYTPCIAPARRQTHSSRPSHPVATALGPCSWASFTARDKPRAPTLLLFNVPRTTSIQYPACFARFTHKKPAPRFLSILGTLSSPDIFYMPRMGGSTNIFRTYPVCFIRLHGHALLHFPTYFTCLAWAASRTFSILHPISFICLHGHARHGRLHKHFPYSTPHVLYASWTRTCKEANLSFMVFASSRDCSRAVFIDFTAWDRSRAPTLLMFNSFSRFDSFPQRVSTSPFKTTTKRNRIWHPGHIGWMGIKKGIKTAT